MGSSATYDYRVPKGEVIDHLIFQDVKKTTTFYKLYCAAKKFQLTEQTTAEEQKEAIRFVKFADMSDKRDVILYVKDGKLKLEKI